MRFSDILMGAAQGGGKITTPVAVTFLSNSAAGSGDLGTLTLGVGLIVIAVDQLYITGANPTVSGITINGVSATRLAGATGTAAGTDETVEIWAAACVAASGNVTVTWNGSPLRGGYGLWLVTNSTGAAYATGTDTGDTPSTTLNVPAKGAIIGAGANVVGTTATTWTGLTTEDYDELVGGANTYHSGAHQLFAAAVTPQTVSNDNTGTSGVAMACVSFAPA